MQDLESEEASGYIVVVEVCAHFASTDTSLPAEPPGTQGRIQNTQEGGSFLTATPTTELAILE